jgi:transcriptional regulator with AAA-type ATPase domain
MNEELADLAVQEIHQFIDTGKQVVQQTHSLYAKLLAWDAVFQHIMFNFPDEVQELNNDIEEILTELRTFLEESEHSELEILQEEEQHLQHLQDQPHKEYRAIKRNEDQLLRLELHELKMLHNYFSKLKHLIEREIPKAIKKHAEQAAQIEKNEEYYYVQIYKFAAAYENIFKQLLDKELILRKKLR